jgi:transposase
LHHQLNCIQLYINALRSPSFQALQTDLQEQKVREEGQIEHPRLRHLPVCGYPTYILITPLRYQCEHCAGNPTTTQKLDCYELRHSGTNAYEDHILLSLINSTIRDVSIREGIGYDVIEGILDRNIRTAADWEKIEKIDIIGIDEISNKKGHKDFLAIVTAYIDGKLRVIAVLKDREKQGKRI